MDTTPAGFYNSPTRCHLAQVVRKDGTIYYYTDTQMKVTWNGHDYLPIDSFIPSSIPQEAGVKLDNWEFVTLNNTTSARIQVSDLVTFQRYNGTRIWLYEIDWKNPANGTRIAGQWRLAKTRISDTKLALEVRDLLSLANNQQGDAYQLDCPVVLLFNLRCDPHQTLRAANTFAATVLYPVDIFTIDVTDTHNSAFFNNGDFKFTSGANNGLFGPIAWRHQKITPAAWSSGTTYAYGDYAIGADTRVYISLKDANTNQNPNANGNPTWWYQLASSPAALGRLLLKLPIPLPAIGDTLNVCAGCIRQIVSSSVGNGCASFANAHNASGTNLENYQGDVLPQADAEKNVARMSG